MTSPQVLQLAHLIQAFAVERQAKIAEQSETPQLAAAFVEMFGRGVGYAARAFIGADGDKQIAQATTDALNAVDPAWVVHHASRIGGKPTDLIY